MLKVTGLLIVALVATFNAGFAWKPVYMVIDANTTDCGDLINVVPWNQKFIVQSMGDSPAENCGYVFRAEFEGNCRGICYNIRSGSFFRDENVTLTVVAGSHIKEFHSNKINRDNPMCSKSLNLSVTLTVPADYDPAADSKVGFNFSMEVYNYCEGLGYDVDNGNSITFDEAIKHLENYHHAEMFDEMVKMNLINGVLVGFGLASIFLIVLCVAFCYVRNSPNRGRKSSSMKVSKSTETGQKPEGVMLLSVTSDPEKPPSDEMD